MAHAQFFLFLVLLLPCCLHGNSPGPAVLPGTPSVQFVLCGTSPAPVDLPFTAPVLVVFIWYCFCPSFFTWYYSFPSYFTWYYSFPSCPHCSVTTAAWGPAAVDPWDRRAAPTAASQTTAPWSWVPACSWVLANSSVSSVAGYSDENKKKLMTFEFCLSRRRRKVK